MARLEMPELTPAGLGEGPVTADTMFELGMMYASGREVPIDLITAHKWFNIAAMKGHAEAATAFYRSIAEGELASPIASFVSTRAVLDAFAAAHGFTPRTTSDS